MSSNTNLAQTNIPGGVVNGVWTVTGSPYNIQGSIQVANGDSLIIQPGVTVKFLGPFKLSVLGKLRAIGSVTDSIIFTSVDTILGWRGIRFDNSLNLNDSSCFSYCKISYGKASGPSPDDCGGALYLNNFSKVIIDNCEITSCSAIVSGGAIYCINSSARINNNLIKSNAAKNGGGMFFSFSKANIYDNNINYNSSNASASYGAGIYSTNSKLTIASNNISYNIISSGSGAGVYIQNGTSLMSENNINNNQAQNQGGGIYISNDTSIIFRNTISSNKAAYGAGIYVRSNCDIKNNLISSNLSTHGGGGIYSLLSPVISENTIANNICNDLVAGGGGILCRQGSPIVNNNRIVNNQSLVRGGGISCNISGNGRFANNVISNNYAQNGGGVYCNSSSNPIFTNNTITNNNSVNGGGIYCASLSSPTFYNSIVWGNTSSSLGSQIYLFDEPSDPSFSYCDIQGGLNDFYLNNNFFTGTYSNNINSAPIFNNPSSGSGIGFDGSNAEWAPAMNSLCINGGTTDTSGLRIPTMDFKGNSRVSGNRVDIGAYEFQFFQASITVNDTTICKGSSVTLNAEVSLPSGILLATDIDGNTYPTVNIGTQIWTQKNLNVSRYRNGDIIPQLLTSSQWSTTTSGAWCYYNNDSAAYSATYGKLYNWYAVNDTRGIAPSGWHVPTNQEFIRLTSFLGGQTVAGGKMKESGFTHWISPNTGATNSSGFTGLPGADRNYFGTFDGQIGAIGAWWSSTESSPNSTFAWQRTLLSGSNSVSYTGLGKGTGLSLRLVRNPITYRWSTGDTTASINVTPSQTTTYYCSINNGDTSCIDSVTVFVGVNPFQDLTKVCGDSVVLDAGGPYVSYLWNTGDSLRTITVHQDGFFKVTVVDSTGCVSQDSTYVSVLNINISQNDTSVCAGTMVLLSIDSLIYANRNCIQSSIPSNLRQGLISYYPFCGNPLDLSGNSNDAVNRGAIPDFDRNFNTNSAYAFDGIDDYMISVGGGQYPDSNFSVSFWCKYLNNTWTASTIMLGASSSSLWGTAYDNSFPGIRLQTGVGCAGGAASRSQVINNNQWYHIVVTNLGDSQNYYVNGNYIGTTRNPISPNCSKDSLYFGNDIFGLPEYFHGSLDDIGIWNRILLPYEVSQLYSILPQITWSTGERTDTIHVSPQQTTTYYVTISNGIFSCTDSIKITIPVIDTSIILLDPSTICSDTGSVRMIAGSAETYQWLLNGAPISGASSQNYTATQTGIYSVAMENSIGCRDTSVSVQINIFPKPAIPIINASGPITFCANSSITLSTTAPPTLQWFNNSLPISGANSPNLTVNQSGQYTVQTTNSFGCVSSSVITSVTVNPIPTGIISPSSGVICTGSSITLTATGGTSYQWLRNGVNISGATGSSYVATLGGTYTVTIFNNGCAGTASNQAVITSVATPTGTISPSSGVICTGSSITLTATGGTSYQWLRNGVNISGATGSSYVATLGGTYTVRIFNNGCLGTASNQAVITSVATPTGTISPSTGVICSGSSITLSATGGTSYQWIRNGVSISGATGSSYVATLGGTYTVTIFNNGCTGTASNQAVITSVASPTGTISPSSGVICSGSSITLTATGGTSYQWLRNGLAITGATASTYVTTLAGTYTVRIFANGCSGTATNQATISAGTTPTGIISPSSGVICPGSSITLTVTGGTSYQWLRNGVIIPGAIGSSFSANQSGTYTVRIVNNGCSGTASNQCTINTLVTPTGQISPSSGNICQGSSVNLSVSGGSSYQWYRNDTLISGVSSSTYGATAAGTYKVRIIGFNGCTAFTTNTALLTLTQRPSADFNFDSYCINTPITFTNTSTVVNSLPVTYQWFFSNGSTSTLASPVQTYQGTGTYNVRMTVTSTLCPNLNSTINKPITIVGPAPNIRYQSVNALANSPLTLNARNINGATYTWIPTIGLNSASLINPIFNYNNEQEYLIRIRAQSGCITTDTLKVNMFNQSDIFVPQGFSPNGDGSNDKLSPILVGMRELRTFQIYNRWGQRVFITSIASDGWDGKYRGIDQPMDTYTWIAEGIGIGGNLIKKSGGTVLVR